MRSTDWEATCDAIEEAVSRDSYLTWLRENEKRAQPGAKHMGSLVRLYCMCDECGLGLGPSVRGSHLHVCTHVGVVCVRDMQLTECE